MNDPLDNMWVIPLTVCILRTSQKMCSIPIAGFTPHTPYPVPFGKGLVSTLPIPASTKPLIPTNEDMSNTTNGSASVYSFR